MFVMLGTYLGDTLQIHSYQAYEQFLTVGLQNVKLVAKPSVQVVQNIVEVTWFKRTG